MRITIVPKFISWKLRKVKVVDDWADVSTKIDLANITLNQSIEVEVETNLQGKSVITNLYD